VASNIIGTANYTTFYGAGENLNISLNPYVTIKDYTSVSNKWWSGNNFTLTPADDTVPVLASESEMEILALLDQPSTSNVDAFSYTPKKIGTTLLVSVYVGYKIYDTGGANANIYLALATGAYGEDPTLINVVSRLIPAGAVASTHYYHTVLEGELSVTSLDEIVFQVYSGTSDVNNIFLIKEAGVYFVPYGGDSSVLCTCQFFIEEVEI